VIGEGLPFANTKCCTLRWSEPARWAYTEADLQVATPQNFERLLGYKKKLILRYGFGCKNITTLHL
jgi:hypothetical protein